MDFLFSQSLEVFLIIMLAAITILLFTGKGSFLLRTARANQKKRTPEQERYLSRHLGVVTLLWMLAEVMLVLFGSYTWITFVYIALLAISMVYLAKFFKKFD